MLPLEDALEGVVAPAPVVPAVVPPVVLVALLAEEPEVVAFIST
jgi:hypothetical protein